MLRLAHLLGLLAGLALALSDYGLLRLLGVEMRLAGHDVNLLVTALFGGSFGALGYAIGRLLQARARAQTDARTIRAQLAALSESQRAVLHNEKLAAIGRLAAGIAHEVRNPLGVIRASAALIQEEFREGDDAHRACRFILEEIDRLNGLITALLGFARPAPLRLMEVALAGVVDRAAALLGEELQRRGVSLLREEAAAIQVRGDPDLLAQLLLGLLHNAAEALAGGGSVAVRLAERGGAAVVEVADSGPGIPPGDEDRVFEPFFTTKASGTGLGLAMAARIAAAHGGALAVVPGAGLGPGGAGACFRLLLPHPEVGP